MIDISLNKSQIDLILSQFNESDQDQSFLSTWKKRLYCPMFIYQSQFCNIKTEIEKQFPDYTIAFDVVFESSGKAVPWHCDYESLGPVIVENPFKSTQVFFL